MALRGQLADRHAIFADPHRGINLNAAEEDLEAGEARLMQNCVYRGGTRTRLGSSRLTGSQVACGFKVRGGTNFYRADGTEVRYIAYDTNISSIADNGTETVVDGCLTSDQDVHFTTWSITDSLYIANNADTLMVIDNAGSFSTVSGTAIPTAKQVMPIRDRLLAITNNGIERSDALDDTVWSSDSSWATFRPDRGGRFQVMHPYTYQGGTDTEPITTAVIAFQADAYYLITGTDFGTDVTSASASANEDASIIRLNTGVGTISPYSVVTVPGVGIFFFTTDLNVYWLPPNQTSGQYIGDKLRSNGSTNGIESANKSALDQVWMTYHDRFLVLAIPTGSNTYATTQFWMDMKAFLENPQRGPVWYGPMTGQTVGRAWNERQAGENKLYGGEGNSATGIFVYELMAAGTYTDAVGTDDNAVAMVYQTYFKSFGRAEREKYLRSIQFDMNNFSGSATADVLDLSGSLASNLTISSV